MYDYRGLGSAWDRIRPSQVCHNYSIAAAGTASQGGIRIVDFVRHNDGLI